MVFLDCWLVGVLNKIKFHFVDFSPLEEEVLESSASRFKSARDRGIKFPWKISRLPSCLHATAAYLTPFLAKKGWNPGWLGDTLINNLSPSLVEIECPGGNPRALATLLSLDLVFNFSSPAGVSSFKAPLNGHKSLDSLTCQPPKFGFFLHYSMWVIFTPIKNVWMESWCHFGPTSQSSYTKTSISPPKVDPYPPFAIICWVYVSSF